MFRCFTAAVLALVATVPCQAGKVKVWHHHTPAQYDKAQLKGAVVSNEGAVRLSRQLRPLAGLDATHVWDLAEDRDGNLYVATGDDGKIFKVTPDGKVGVAFTSEDSQVLCLAAAPDGSIYAGTGPGGHIIRIDPKGAAKVIYACPDSYVWSLAVDAKGDAIYAGTGPKGRIYRITPDGKGSVFYTTKQEHILCLAAGPDGMLYAGADKSGLVYRIDPRGKGFVVFSAPQAEVRTLAVTKDAVYAGTSATVRRRGPSGTARGDSESPALAPHMTLASRRNETKAGPRAAAPGSPSSSAEAHEPGQGAAAAPPSASGENSLYRIGADGTVREVFREKALVLCHLRQNGRIFVGTGMEGRLFEVEEATRECSEIARLDHGQVLCLCKRRDGSIVLGAGDPGKLYTLHDQYAARGSVVSEVLDARMISKWGALRWTADTPTGTALSVAVRSGNVAEPDDTWSDWSAEQTDPRQAIVTAPPARFLQYRVTLTTTNPDATPALHGLTLRYMTTNQAPEVTSLEVPDLDAVNLDNPKKIRFRWNATDSNEDELTYSIFIKKYGWKSWILLEENLDRKDYDWDTTTTPSGVYRFKVVASDRKDNSDEEALTGERVGGPFVVSHEPPKVTIKVAGMEGDQAMLEATASSPWVRLTAASFSLNGKKWVNVFPTDGLFDSKTETFKFKTGTLKPGAYVVVLRVRDAAANVGTADVVFTVQARGQR
jgi:sugar lactone lactonase YvrE